jgi:D-alanyl-lipoteichoic acid acyltransferase DltB (MBOAT superfamily)
LWLVAGGMTKKVVFGDFLLAPFVDSVFQYPGVTSAPTHLIAFYSLAFQIYFDFSGYSDIARGLACLLGYELPLNFAEPYLSRNPAEFWRRWHMTLSRWLRDYLYIPLGGNRRGAARPSFNLLATMVLGGLWHGANWTFLVWGALHGALLIGHRLFSRDREPSDSRLSVRDVPAIVLTFHAVTALWVFFRAPNVQAAWSAFGALATTHWSTEWPVLQIGVVLLCCAAHVLERIVVERSDQILAATRLSWPAAAAEGLALGASAVICVLCNGSGATFIYFQF